LQRTACPKKIVTSPILTLLLHFHDLKFSQLVPKNKVKNKNQKELPSFFETESSIANHSTSQLSKIYLDFFFLPEKKVFC